jgi:hypothetical protein
VGNTIIETAQMDTQSISLNSSKPKVLILKLVSVETLAPKYPALGIILINS